MKLTSVQIFIAWVRLFYTFLNGKPPFHDSKITQKLVDHQIKEPPPLHQFNRNIPRPMADIVAKMMAKKPEGRFQTPAELIKALLPWSKQPDPQWLKLLIWGSGCFDQGKRALINSAGVWKRPSGFFAIILATISAMAEECFG